MFVIYNPELDTFVSGVIIGSSGPSYEWDRRISKSSTVDTVPDAVTIAQEVREEWIRKSSPIHSVQVLRMKAPGLPDFKNPVFDLPSPRRVS